MTRIERWMVWGSAIATVATGVGYYWAKYLVAPPTDWAVINHPLQPWLLKAHILASPALLFAVGMVWVRHIWRHWRSGTGQGRRSGLAGLVSLVPMVATGYLVQVVTNVSWARAFAWAHVGFGLVFAAGLAVHQLAVRTGKRTVERRPVVSADRARAA